MNNPGAGGTELPAPKRCVKCDREFVSWPEYTIKCPICLGAPEKSDREIVDMAKRFMGEMKRFRSGIYDVPLFHQLIAIAEASLLGKCEKCADYLCPACVDKFVNAQLKRKGKKMNNPDAAEKSDREFLAEFKVWCDKSVKYAEFFNADEKLRPLYARITAIAEASLVEKRCDGCEYGNWERHEDEDLLYCDDILQYFDQPFSCAHWKEKISKEGN